MNILNYTPHYRRAGISAILVACIAHALFILLFYGLGLLNLSILNIFSVILYLYCLYLFPKALIKRDYRKITFLATIELAGHALVVCYYLGSDSGFQYYMYLILVLPFFGFNLPTGTNLLRIFFVILGSVFLDIWINQRSPQVFVDEKILLLIRNINLSLFLLAASGVSFYYIRVLHSHQKILKKLASIDMHTGINNRYSLTVLAEKEISRSRRNEQPLSLLIIDIDLFKKVNDTYGHLCGDYIIKCVVDTIKSVLRTEDSVGRWGGEEFIVLLPNTDSQKVQYLAERLRLKVEKSLFTYEDKKISVTITLGGSTLGKNDTFNSLLSTADNALYKGKANGRNCYFFGY